MFDYYFTYRSLVDGTVSTVEPPRSPQFFCSVGHKFFSFDPFAVDFWALPKSLDEFLFSPTSTSA